MWNNVYGQPAGNTTRRKALHLGLALTIVATGLTAASSPRAAHASLADQFTCTGPASIFNTTTSGALVRRDLTPYSESGAIWGAAKTISTGGWQNFGRLLGGPDGRIYGINSAGLTRYRWTGTAFELVDGKASWVISTNFTAHASGSMRDKITIDERGDFYLVDSTGKLRLHRFDEATRQWTISGRVLDTGWDKYNAIVAAGDGVLYARAAATGHLHRYWIEPESQRVLSNGALIMGVTPWGSYTRGLFSIGGDTVYGIDTAGNLYQHRKGVIRTENEMRATLIGTGWGGYPNVFATSNSCHQGALTSPTKPSTPTQQNSPIAVMQAPPDGTALGTIEYTYVDNIGQVRHGRQTNPDDAASIQWSTLSGLDAYTGKPALVADAQKRVNLLAHQTTSDVRALTQTAPASPSWNAWSNLAGAMKSEPAVVRLSDGSLAVFAIDAAGILWVRQQDGSGGDLMPWRNLGGSGLTGTPLLTAGVDGMATVTVTDSTGAVLTATYRNRALTTALASIGGSGFTGTPAVVLMPGLRMMIIARHDDGTIKNQLQNADGTWPGTWATIETPGIIPVGSPAAVLSSELGRILVVTRTTDGTIHYAWETAPGSAAWQTWNTVPTGEVYTTDPTAFVYERSGGAQVAYVTRTQAGSVRLFAPPTDPTALARSTSAKAPAFEEVKIPQPRR